jgi:hydroxyethylthiazole kinase-like uncharacterized protein yjeF
MLRDWALPPPGSNKNSKGGVLIIGGGRRTPGAVLLSAEAALRAGAGKVQVMTVRSTATELAVAAPELLVAGAHETQDGEIAAASVGLARELAQDADIVLIGPGFMSPRAAVDLSRALLPTLTIRIVMDALSLAYLAAEPGVTFDDGQAVLTPNTGEVALALNVDAAELDSEQDAGAARLAHRTNATVTAGGSTTWVAAPDGRTWRDPAGYRGLGVSGSGDVKAGIVAACFTRTLDPAQAAVWAGHLHGRAGERLAQRVGPIGYLARETAAEVPAVMASLGS